MASTKPESSRSQAKPPIDDLVLQNISEISRLKLSPQEFESLGKDANQILSYFSQVSGLGAKGEAVFYLRPGDNLLRADVVEKFEGDLKIRSQFAHATKEGLLKAPKNL